MALLVPGNDPKTVNLVVCDPEGENKPEIVGSVSNVEIAAILGDKRAQTKLELQRAAESER